MYPFPHDVLSLIQILFITVTIEPFTAERIRTIEVIEPFYESIRRLQGVVIARQYVWVDYDVEEKNLEAACKVTPGLESPTISPLQKSGWVAVRAMVTRSSIHHVMDDLYGGLS